MAPKVPKIQTIPVPVEVPKVQRARESEREREREGGMEGGREGEIWECRLASLNQDLCKAQLGGF